MIPASRPSIVAPTLRPGPTKAHAAAARAYHYYEKKPPPRSFIHLAEAAGRHASRCGRRLHGGPTQNARRDVCDQRLVADGRLSARQQSTQHQPSARREGEHRASGRPHAACAHVDAARRLSAPRHGGLSALCRQAGQSVPAAASQGARGHYAASRHPRRAARYLRRRQHTAPATRARLNRPPWRTPARIDRREQPWDGAERSELCFDRAGWRWPPSPAVDGKDGEPSSKPRPPTPPLEKITANIVWTREKWESLLGPQQAMATTVAAACNARHTDAECIEGHARARSVGHYRRKEP